MDVFLLIVGDITIMSFMVSSAVMVDQKWSRGTCVFSTIISFHRMVFCILDLSIGVAKSTISHDSSTHLH